MAFLTATPKGAEFSRGESMRMADPENPGLELPEIGAATYLAGYWLELGQCGASGFGPVPLSFLEIEAWQNATGVRLDPWEALQIRSMSDAYVRELSRASDSSAVAPIREDDIDHQRRKVDAALRAFARLNNVPNRRSGNANR